MTVRGYHDSHNCEGETGFLFIILFSFLPFPKSTFLLFGNKHTLFVDPLVILDNISCLISGTAMQTNEDLGLNCAEVLKFFSTRLTRLLTSGFRCAILLSSRSPFSRASICVDMTGSFLIFSLHFLQ